MELIPLSAISIGDRQRKFFPLDKLIDLADDIRRNGLLHAPVLQADSLELLAGERRLRAIEMIYDTGGQFMYAGELIPPELVPVTRAHSRDAIGWAEAELAENLARQDLTWQERAGDAPAGRTSEAPEPRPHHRPDDRGGPGCRW